MTNTPGILSVATDAIHAPFESMQNSAPAGFDIDLMNEIAKELKLTVTYTPL
jgi:ABC-type amino acid transport substrate-binding protein